MQLTRATRDIPQPCRIPADVERVDSIVGPLPATPGGLVDREGGIRARLDDISDGSPSAAERALLARLMTSFTDNTPGGIDRLADLLDRGDITAAQHQAHRLKGSADNLGVTLLADMFARVEDDARDGRLPATAATIDALRHEYQAVASICGRITAGLRADT